MVAGSLFGGLCLVALAVVSVAVVGILADLALSAWRGTILRPWED